MHSTDILEDGYKGSGKVLWYSINKHGIENHVVEILDFLPSRDKLKAREKELVNETLILDPLCMNLAVGGEGGNKIEWTEGRRIAQSEHFKNMARTEEHYKKVSNKLRGKPLSEERKQKISETNKGKKITEEQKKKWMESMSDRDSIFSWKLVGPDGNIYIANSLAKFCKEHDLSYTSLYKNLAYSEKIVRGKAKGWKTLEKFTRIL